MRVVEITEQMSATAARMVLVPESEAEKRILQVLTGGGVRVGFSALKALKRSRHQDLSGAVLVVSGLHFSKGRHLYSAGRPVVSSEVGSSPLSSPAAVTELERHKTGEISARFREVS